MARFTNYATLSYNGGTTDSNTVTGELLATLSMTKTAVRDTYTPRSRVAYAVSLVNSGTTAVTGVTVTDDLGGYTFGEGTVYPLAYTESSLRYYINGVLQTAPAVTAGPPLVISGISVPAGGNALLVYETQDARLLKAFCIRLESEGEAGRLFDLDVLDANGEKLSRETGRTCLVCGGPVSVCSRSRAHGLEAITARTRTILEAFAAETLGEMAENALLAEVHFTPKPGLVDEANNGAHRDMDVPLFERSAHALRPCFEEFVRLGIQGASPAALQQAGVRAEQAMFAATGGVNTHKGAIYSGALLLHAAGRLLSGEEEGNLCELAAQTAAAIPAPTGTHGAAVRACCGGIRTEAVSGYPTAQAVLRQLRQSGPLDALLLSMSRLDDSTVRRAHSLCAAARQISSLRLHRNGRRGHAGWTRS